VNTFRRGSEERRHARHEASGVPRRASLGRDADWVRAQRILSENAQKLAGVGIGAAVTTTR
jgi:hypothetical protein